MSKKHRQEHRYVHKILNNCDKDFKNLVKNLDKRGYRIELSDDGGYYFARGSNGNVRLGFCTESDSCYPDLNNVLAADCEDLFDKWHKCPVKLPIPTNNMELGFLLATLRWLETEDGHDVSNNFIQNSYITRYPIVRC